MTPREKQIRMYPRKQGFPSPKVLTMEVAGLKLNYSSSKSHTICQYHYLEKTTGSSIYPNLGVRAYMRKDGVISSDHAAESLSLTSKYLPGLGKRDMKILLFHYSPYAKTRKE